MTARVVIFRRGKKRRTLSISRQSPSLSMRTYMVAATSARSARWYFCSFSIVGSVSPSVRPSVGRQQAKNGLPTPHLIVRPSVRPTAALTDPLTPFTSPSRPGLIHNRHRVTAEKGAPWNYLHAREGFSDRPVFSLSRPFLLAELPPQKRRRWRRHSAKAANFDLWP